eukprot:3095740-Rhodomonas_salina.2
MGLPSCGGDRTSTSRTSTQLVRAVLLLVVVTRYRLVKFRRESCRWNSLLTTRLMPLEKWQCNWWSTAHPGTTTTSTSEPQLPGTSRLLWRPGNYPGTTTSVASMHTRIPPGYPFTPLGGRGTPVPTACSLSARTLTTEGVGQERYPGYAGTEAPEY